MFDGDFGPKHPCLMWPVDFCVYAWCISSCACVMHSRLRPHHQHLSFVVAVIALLSVPSGNAILKWSSCTCTQGACWRHMLLLQPSCYHCQHCVTWYDSITHSRTRPCCLSTLYKTRYEMHKALSSLTLWDVTLKMVCACAQGLVAIAAVQSNVKMHWLIWNWSFVLA